MSALPVRVATPEAVRLIKATTSARAAARPSVVYTADELERASLLVDAVWRAGQEVGVVPRDWAMVTSLGHQCLDAVRQTTIRAAQRGGAR